MIKINGKEVKPGKKVKVYDNDKKRIGTKRLRELLDEQQEKARKMARTDEGTTE